MEPRGRVHRRRRVRPHRRPTDAEGHAPPSGRRRRRRSSSTRSTASPRSMEDHVAIRAALRHAGVQLVSVTENIEETASGRLVEGIHALMAEFYSANLAGEIRKGMTQKAKMGGWPTKAPIGYLNVRRGLRPRDDRFARQPAGRAGARLRRRRSRHSCHRGACRSRRRVSGLRRAQVGVGRRRSIPRSASVSAHVDAGPVRPNESPALYGAGLSRVRNRCQWPPSEITGQTNDFTIPMSKAAPAFSAARTSESSSKTPSLPP